MNIHLPMAPMGKARPRMSRNGRVHMPAKYRAWVKRATAIMRAAKRGQSIPAATPVQVQVTLVHKRPKRLIQAADGGSCPVRSYPGDGRQWCPRAKPDVDNAAGSVLDALTAAGVYVDDVQVVVLEVVKKYAALGESPCVEVWVGDIR